MASPLKMAAAAAENGSAEHLEVEAPVLPTLQRQKTEVEQAVSEYRAEAAKLLDEFVTVQTPAPQSVPFRNLEGCFFVGHLATDLDSVGCAIGAAELFDGVATVASALNTETQWALEYWGFKAPPLYKDALASDELGRLPNGAVRPVCLVDHNQRTQLAEGVLEESIRGIVDHHAIQNHTVITSQPIWMLIQPWGSCATIIAQMFLDSKKAMRRQTAGILLSAILSDTLSCKSPTTTDADRLMVSLLAQLAGVPDIDLLASQQFKAKSRMLDELTTHQLINGDLKTFSFTHSNFSGIVAWGTVESPGILDTVGKDRDKISELRYEMRAIKHERGAALGFVSLVDIVLLRSVLIICGHAEQQIAEQAFGGKVQNGILDLGDRVSRKLDFVPAVSRVLASGWMLPKSPTGADEEKFEIGNVYVDCSDGKCRTIRQRPASQLRDFEDFESQQHSPDLGGEAGPPSAAVE